MKEETFYRKYANLPIIKRSTEVAVMTENGYAPFSPDDIYRALNVETEKRRQAEVEINKLLKIGEIILD